ncbi:hypothetical protein GCM10007874_13060 [Labrys miyagiensis]|uniref:Uncharacterized protein n=1 Tax=Labrys miyagiensis TaxID=346912 RepID=A0ABQ6CER9_9HYPH|nr:UPF0280 family protein [Labrys miyagiensis]GLS18289.1 hypothetical protein GCM10007874_13060 [Labrys miyagiensis]
MSPQAAILADGRRLHLQHGPIDLVIEAFGEVGAVQDAYRTAARRFDGLLEELCAELPLLRAKQRSDSAEAEGIVARRMQAAVSPHAAAHFITPMAAVAGSVADEILAAMLAAAPLRRAYVNNGGDIALHLAEGEVFAIGLVDRPDQPSLFARSEIRAADGVGGIATSGWRGRSFSLGIADAVTVLAPSAAMADAAATIIANAVDLPGHTAVTRLPAVSLQPDSDLGERLVTRGVGVLTPGEIALALQGGEIRARDLIDAGLIAAAALHLAGATRLVPTSYALIQPEAA